MNGQVQFSLENYGSASIVSIVCSKTLLECKNSLLKSKGSYALLWWLVLILSRNISIVDKILIKCWTKELSIQNKGNWFCIEFVKDCDWLLSC